MNSQYSNPPLNYICEGCLSADRKLSTICDEEHKQIFTGMLDSMESVNQELQLCWECSATIRGMIGFRGQVRAAHDCLVRYMVCQTAHIASLSKLTKTNINTTHYYQDKEDVKALITTSDGVTPNCAYEITNYSNSNFVNIPNISKVISEAEFTNDEMNDIKNNVETESRPVFVKIEDNDFDLGDNFYEDENSLTDNKEVFTEDDVPGSCVSCLTGKMSVTSFPSVGSGRAAYSLELIHSDDCGPMQVSSWGGARYLLTFTDDCTRKSFGYLMKSKSENSVKADDVRTTEDTVKKIKRAKSRKKKKKREEFDPSDDEPLKPSKEMDSTNKHETGDKTMKKRRSKREKPAGVVNNPRVHRNLARLNVRDGQIEMVVLSWEEVEAERLRARTSVVFTRHEYRCEHCVLGFNHRFKLDNHMAKHAPSAGAAECPVCHVRCRDDHALVAHKRRHRVRWRCAECGELASRAAVAADHAARAHGAAPTHTCRRCGLTAESLAKLRNHMKNHAERQKCELCGKTFRDRTSLRTHLFIHRGEKEYSCPHCDKRFLFKKAMEVHLVTHAQPARLYCLECDMTFKNRMSYYQHQKYNLKHIDPAKLKYKCPLCDKKFLKAARLEEHNFAVHLKVTPIHCTMPNCNFACSSRPVLRTHVRMVHRNLRAVRNHVCDACGKAYTTKKTLEGHMRSHTGERPFHCALCPSTFAYEAALYNHNKLVHLKGKVSRRADWAPGAALA